MKVPLDDNVLFFPTQGGPVKNVLFSTVWIIFTSCATLTKEQCATMNWRDLGFRDASQGYSSTRLSQHVNSCSKHGLTIDNTSYSSGYSDGLRLFCTPERGYELGRAGSFVTATCPADLATAFQISYERGKQEREIASKPPLSEPTAKGGVCNGFKSAGVCLIFSGVRNSEEKILHTNQFACKILQGEFSSTGNCTSQGRVGRCTVQKGSPDEYILVYYSSKLSRDAAQKDCANSQSSLHVQGAGEWTPEI